MWQLQNKGGEMDINIDVLGKASTQFTVGALLEIVSGIAQHVSSATDYPAGLFKRMWDPLTMRDSTDNLTTTTGQMLQMTPLAGRRIPAFCDVTPYINGVAAGSNTSKTTVVVDDAANNGALVGSTVYIPELDQHGIVTADSKAGSTHTLTVKVIGAAEFRKAPSNQTDSDEITATVKLVPFAVGAVQVKLDSTNPHLRIGVAVADASGGHIEIYSVDLSKNQIGCLFPQLPAV